MKIDEIKLIEYLSKESEHVRKAYDDRVSQTRLLEQYSLLSTGLIWSWCATNYELPTVQILIWMPSIITLLFGVRAWGNANAMYRNRDYLVQIENRLALPEDIGWGRYLKNNQERRLAATAYAFWTILQVLTIIIPTYLIIKG
jgi:hypothetical protein